MNKKQMWLKIFSAAAKHEKKFPKNSLIYLEGDVCEEIALVITGTIQAKNMYQNGREMITRIIHKGDVIGGLLIYADNNQYKASFYAKDDVVLQFISKKEFEIILNENNIFKTFFISYLTNTYNELNDYLKLLRHKKLRAKLAYLLYTWSQEYNTYEFLLPLKQYELADYLYVERTSLAREIKKMIAERIINCSYNHCKILDMQKIIESFDQ